MNGSEILLFGPDNKAIRLVRHKDAFTATDICFFPDNRAHKVVISFADGLESNSKVMMAIDDNAAWSVLDTQLTKFGEREIIVNGMMMEVQWDFYCSPAKLWLVPKPNVDNEREPQ